MALKTKLNGSALLDRFETLTATYRRDVATLRDAAEQREGVVTSRLVELEEEKQDLRQLQQLADNELD